MFTADKRYVKQIQRILSVSNVPQNISDIVLSIAMPKVSKKL